MFGIVKRCAVMIAAAMLIVFAINSAERPELRDFPYPYSAMLTLQSHIDGSTDEEFETIHHYLNVELGLDVGDSMWMYNLNDGISYRDGDSFDPGAYMTWFLGGSEELNSAELIKKYWDLNYIDSIHTVGDFSRIGGDVAFTRELAERAYRTMNENGIYPTVWINHGTETNVQNLGGYMPFRFTSYQRGDDPKSEYYHADLMCKAGVQFVWNSINDVRLGMKDPLFPIFLRDGQKLWGFKAYTGYEQDGEYMYMWSPYNLTEILTGENLDKLVENREFSIIANHFGSSDVNEMLCEGNRYALQLLKKYQDKGKILVSRSSKLLRYAEVRKYVKFEKNGDDINILSIADPVLGEYAPEYEHLRGITFYVDDADSAVLQLRGEIVPEELVQRNPADETGQESIGFVW